MYTVIGISVGWSKRCAEQGAEVDGDGGGSRQRVAGPA
jgi:hypothetical protein